MCSSSKSFKFFFTNGDVPVQSSYWNYPLEEEESQEENQSKFLKFSLDRC